MLDNIKALPKIELHCHMDGSISHETLRKLAYGLGESYTLSEIIDLTTASMDCKDLGEYLAKFDIPLKCIRTADGLQEIAYDYVKQAYEDNIKYAEMRFAPGSCLGSGLTYDTVFDSVEAGLTAGCREYGIDVRILVCAMRHLPMEDNLTMLKAARNHMDTGYIVGCDIAGDEKAHTNMEVREFFDKARSYNIPFTIHSGECGNAQNIVEAIELGAGRIGHGIAMAGHPDIIKLCADKRIGVEMCPTSNLQTKAVSSISAYPFSEFYNNNVLINLSTDNRTVSGTTLTKEYELIGKHFELTDEMCARIYRDSVETSFADDATKHRLLKFL